MTAGGRSWDAWPTGASTGLSVRSNLKGCVLRLKGGKYGFRWDRRERKAQPCFHCGALEREVFCRVEVGVPVSRLRVLQVDMEVRGSQALESILPLNALTHV